MLKRKKKNPVYPGWHDFVAGAVAGAGARMLTHPLDLIRIRRQLAAYSSEHVSEKAFPSMWQSAKDVIEKEGGIRGLFRGNLAALNLWVSYTAVQFYSYNAAKKYFQGMYPGEEHRTGVAFCAGASAGVIATISTYPTDLMRTIFAARGVEVEHDASIAAKGEQQPTKAKHEFRPPKTMREFATNLYRQSGWRGFFAGCPPTVLQIIPYMGCSFAIYDTLTSGDRGIALSAYAGSVAGAVSKALVYPMDTVKKRLQAQSFFGSRDSIRGTYYTGIYDCIVTIYRLEGFLAFYSGLVPSVLKTALAAGLSFTFFRGTKNFLESMHDEPFSDQNPPSRMSLTRRITGQ